MCLENRLYENLKEILEKNVSAQYFLSSGYLHTLEKHIERQKNSGNGFGYRIVNAVGIDNPVANTLLATGGSGKERNLIYAPKNGKKYAGKVLKGKYSKINNKSIRAMTPTEWGRLQGFIGYAFLDTNGNELFSFPKEISMTQQYKQFGNSVTIPVIEEMALFIKNCLSMMEKTFSDVEKRLYSMYGKDFFICKKIENNLAKNIHKKTLNTYFDVVCHFSNEKSFMTSDVMKFLHCTSSRASQILKQLFSADCLCKIDSRKYSFPDWLKIKRKN